MKKNIQNFTELLQHYVGIPNRGALFVDCETVLSSCIDYNPYKRSMAEAGESIILSSKDCFFLVKPPLGLCNGEDCKYLSANGLSSLALLDETIYQSILPLHRDRSISITCISTTSCLLKSDILEKHLFDNIALITDESLQKLIATKDRSSQLFLLNSSLRSLSKEPGRKLYIVDPAMGKDLNQIASLLYLLDTSNIVIATRALAESFIREDEKSCQYSLYDSQVILPPHRQAYLLKDNLLSIGGVTAVINLYKRYDTTYEIYQQLCNQTYPVSTIYIWVNGIEDVTCLSHLRERMPRARFIISDDNLGVWARFSFGLNVQTEYTVIFDDDTVPGLRWIENCIDTIKLKPSLLGTVGLIYESETCYMSHRRYGWPAPNESTVEVDIVGHSWFFRTEWLKYYWASKEYLCGIDFCGEDMHFSFALQLNGIPTSVPPHPASNTSLWGSLKGYEKGTGVESISMSGKGSHMDMPLRRLVARGFALRKFSS